MLKNIASIISFLFSHPLTRNHRTAAMVKFARWQIGARILGRAVIVPWVDESVFIASIGETGLTGNLYTGFMEFEDMLFLLHALRSDEVFVDVGANIGAYTILASKVVRANSISFEPLPDTAIRLQNQVQINDIREKVSIRNRGVGDRSGCLLFTNNQDTINRVSLSGVGKNTTEVPVTTLDEELEENIKYFFKIDVEGFEYNVIKGASKILSSLNAFALIIELNGSGKEYGYDDQDIHDLVVGLDFQPISYDPIQRKVKRLTTYNRNGQNTIYVKDIDAIAARCSEAPARYVHTAFGVRI